MPRIDEKTKVRCTCGQSFCRVMVSVRTRQNHERDIAAAEEDSSENGDNEDEEMGVASGDVNDSSDDGMDGGPQAISNPIEAQGAGNEDMIWDALYDEEEGPVGTINAIRPAYRYEDENTSESSDDQENGRYLAASPAIVEDFDVLDYEARLNEDLTDAESESDSETQSNLLNRAGSSNSRSPAQHAAVREPLNPAIIQLIEGLDSPYYHSISEESIKKVKVEQDYWDNIRADLTADEIDNLIGFSLRTTPGFSSTMYERVRAAFSHRINLGSTFKSNSIGEKLSETVVEEVDCCANSCMAFTGDHAELATCLICSEPRRDGRGRRRNASYHFSIIDRLRGMYQDSKQSRALNRTNVQPNGDPDVLADKFDGDYFKDISQKTIIVEGVDTGVRYFSDGRDLSLTIALDGFTFFETVGKHKSKTKYNSWLVIAMIDNLDPLIRTHRKNIMVLAVIPGPGSPKDLNSYLHWLKRDLHILSLGVLSWDAAKREWFLLRAFLLWIIGDMPAIAHIMNMKGHNGICPCRSCYIQGVRNASQGKTTHYPAILRPDGSRIDISSLLTTNGRTQETFLADVAEIQEIEATGTAAAYKKRQQAYGINGWSILYPFRSVDFPRSFPHDLMHLGGLNVIPNLTLIWTGEFKGLKDAGGDFNYLINAADWAEVGRRTEDANVLIPYAFSRAIPNIARKPSMTAEGWFFWFLAIAPYALHGILKEPYYSHAMDLVRIIRACMKFTITRTEVTGTLTERCQKWVQDYERLYYQGREDRLAVCTSTVHAWLHIPQDTLNSGPIWQSWAFPMEREVQWAKERVKHARLHPFVHMASCAVRREQIKQLGHRLGLAEWLDISQRIANSKKSNLGPKHEQQIDDYRDFELCSPRKLSVRLEEDTRALIAAHLAALHRPADGELGDGDIAELGGYEIDFFKGIIPRTVQRWGKVRISRGGDTTVGANQEVPSEGHRDASFIRYHMNVEGTNQVLYGQFHHAFKFSLPAFDAVPTKIYILAIIRPCITNGLDATTSPVFYTAHGPLGVADLTCFVSTVGRIPMGGDRYGIIDRSTEESWPTVYEPLPEEQDES